MHFCVTHCLMSKSGLSLSLSWNQFVWFLLLFCLFGLLSVHLVWFGFIFLGFSLFALLCDSLSAGQKRAQSQSELEPVCLASVIF